MTWKGHHTIIVILIIIIVALIIAWASSYMPVVQENGSTSYSFYGTPPASGGYMANQGMITSQGYNTSYNGNGNFNQIGTFVFNNSGYQQQDAWYLVYGTSGFGAQTVQLIFTPQSVCVDAHTMSISCTLGVAFDSGVQVSVQGVRSGGVVTVAQLTRLQ